MVYADRRYHETRILIKKVSALLLREWCIPSHKKSLLRKVKKIYRNYYVQ